MTSTPSVRDSKVDTAVARRSTPGRFRARRQRIDQMAVLDHVRERFARLDIAGKGQKRRTGGVLQFGVGDDHVENRLRSVRDLVPDPERLEQPAAGGDDGGGARIAARTRRKRRIGDDDRNIGAEPLAQRQRQRQPGKSAAADDNASLCRHAVPLRFLCPQTVLAT